jgi:carbonic anhydrase
MRRLAPLLLILCAAAQADEPELRQRLAERLKSQDPAMSVEAGRARAHGKPAAKPAPKPAPKPPVPWGYTGEGAPERWGELAPENKLCAVGNRQSPIDLRDTLKVDLEPIQFDYRPGGFTVLDTGRTVQVSLPPGQSITVRQRRFMLQSIQFRRPAEERINGRGFDLSAQLLHRDDQGRLAIVSVLFNEGEASQPALQKIWNHLPLERLTPEPIPDGLDLTAMLPKERGYFTTMGSLTTPPCTEDVLWLVLREPVSLTAQQLAVFSRLYPMNARPVQPAGGRIVKESF